MVLRSCKIFQFTTLAITCLTFSLFALRKCAQVAANIHAALGFEATSIVSQESSIKMVQSAKSAIGIQTTQPAHDSLPLVEKFVPSLLNGVSVPDCHDACDGLPVNTTACSEACKALAKFMKDAAEEGGVSTKRLVIVPLDFLASLVDHDWYAMVKRGFVDELVRSPAYQRSHGTNHALICLTAGCTDVMRDLAVEIPNGLGSRAMWVGTTAGVAGVMWPCPHRVVSVPEIWDDGFGRGFKNAVVEIKRLGFGRGVWECDSPSMPASGWDVDVALGTEEKWVGLVVEDYKFMYCAIPKCGSTRAKMLLRRIMGMEDWRTVQGHDVHMPSKNGLKIVGKRRNKTSIKAYEDDPGFVKVVVVRNPAVRLLSGYLSKVVELRKNYAIPKNAHWNVHKKIPTFHQFVNMLANAGNLDNLNNHFRPQSAFCGLRYSQKDFVARLETIAVDMKEFMESKGLWEPFGQDGWGDKGDEPFYQASVYKAPNHSDEQIRKYYDNNLLRKVYKLYQEDFDRFGYSIDQWLV